SWLLMSVGCFFFQAEDGIRDDLVTGVQTCALPISPGGGRMKIKAVNGFARTLKSEGVPWVSCYPTSPVNNALGEEGVPILMMGEERFAVAVADDFSRVTCGKQIGVCTVMAGLNAAGIQ